MKQLKLASSKYKVVDEDGNILLEAPIAELYYTIALATENYTDKKQGFINAAKEVNEAYGSSLDWGQIIELSNSVHDEMESLKKNTTFTQE